MGEALEKAYALLKPWVEDHPDSYPPIVINISDGAATDTGPTGQANELRNLSTNDGPVLLFNCHISENGAEPIVFPAGTKDLPDEFARELFGVSSPLPENLAQLARSEGLELAPESRGFAFNADLTELIRFLDLRTRSSHLK